MRSQGKDKSAPGEAVAVALEHGDQAVLRHLLERRQVLEVPLHGKLQFTGFCQVTAVNSARKLVLCCCTLPIKTAPGMLAMTRVPLHDIVANEQQHEGKGIVRSEGPSLPRTTGLQCRRQCRLQSHWPTPQGTPAESILLSSRLSYY